MRRTGISLRSDRDSVVDVQHAAAETASIHQFEALLAIRFTLRQQIGYFADADSSADLLKAYSIASSRVRSCPAPHADRQRSAPSAVCAALMNRPEMARSNGAGRDAIVS